jgi:hypothetical protein
MSDYRKPWEGIMVDIIKDAFREDGFINPSDPHHEVGWQTKGMKYFDEDLLPKIDVVVFAGFQNAPFRENAIGSGVAYEIKAYRRQHSNMPRVYEINRKNRTIHKVDPYTLDHRFMDRNETRVMLRKYNATYR